MIRDLTAIFSVFTPLLWAIGNYYVYFRFFVCIALKAVRTQKQPAQYEQGFAHDKLGLATGGSVCSILHPVEALLSSFV